MSYKFLSNKLKLIYRVWSRKGKPKYVYMWLLKSVTSWSWANIQCNANYSFPKTLIYNKYSFSNSNKKISTKTKIIIKNLQKGLWNWCFTFQSRNFLDELLFKVETVCSSNDKSDRIRSYRANIQIKAAILKSSGGPRRRALTTPWSLAWRKSQCYAYATSIPNSLTLHELDLLPDANRCIPPKAGGSVSSILLGRDAAAVGGGGGGALMFCSGGEFVTDDEAVGSTTGCLLPPLRKILARKLAKNPFFCFSTDLSFAVVASSASDEWWWLLLFFCRFRSFFDLTFPIHDTLGEEGSIIDETDFPPDPDRFGNNRMFPDLQWRRFFAST